MEAARRGVGFILALSLLCIPGVPRVASADWLKIYNGAAGYDDMARSIAVDSQGCILVAGDSQQPGKQFDYLTLKYSPHGKLLWANRYNGPANGDDRVSGIVVDGAGNAYVTGRSQGIGTDYDYATVKYGKDGRRVWVARTNGAGAERPQAITLDSEGGVCVTGNTSTGNEDILTVKYAPTGKPDWVRQYNRGGQDQEWASGIAADRAGNVYVTGMSMGSNSRNKTVTIKYGNTGAILWEKTYEAGYENWPSAIGVDAKGHAYVAGVRVLEDYSSNYLTLKYHRLGRLLWAKEYREPRNESNSALALAVDSAGNSHVAGSSYHLEFSWSGFKAENQRTVTVKYDPEGRQLWARSFQGNEVVHDYIPVRIALDQKGSSYVSKGLLGPGTSYDYVTLKYGTGGALKWVERFDRGKLDRPFGIAVGADGKSCVTGMSMGSNGYDFATLQYSDEQQ